PRNSVGTVQLKNNAVNSAKVRNGSLRAVDFAAGQIPAGPQGPAGPPGASGLQVISGRGASNSSSPKSHAQDGPAGQGAGGGGGLGAGSTGLEPELNPPGPFTNGAALKGWRGRRILTARSGPIVSSLQPKRERQCATGTWGGSS